MHGQDAELLMVQFESPSRPGVAQTPAQVASPAVAQLYRAGTGCRGFRSLSHRRRRSSSSRIFAAGLLTGREEARIEAAMRVATEAYADLAKVKAYWR
jgi:hypothetical protein